MTASPIANPTPCTATPAPDPVRARVTANSQYELATAAWQPEPSRSAPLLPNIRSPRLRSLHPGDIVYWVACLGGAGLLLLCATT